jgi:hypothetical protein
VRFRRIEIHRVVRHQEELHETESRELLKTIKDRGLRFSIEIAGGPHRMAGCVVHNVGEQRALIGATSPSRVRVRPRISDIQCIDVECNSEVLVEEGDSGGRWAIFPAAKQESDNG